MSPSILRGRSSPRPSPRGRPPALARRPGTPGATGSGRRILVVDDHRDGAESLAEVLRLYGHTVRVACSARDGLRLARSMLPEVILCDLGLPQMDGYELAREVRRDARLARTRLVAVTGYASPEDVSHALAAGFEGHLAKPPDLERLVRLLEG